MLCDNNASFCFTGRTIDCDIAAIPTALGTERNKGESRTKLDTEHSAPNKFDVLH